MSKTNKLLSDEARAGLLAAYKADKKTDAPANISDKTLITHYGNEAQKALLEVAQGGTPANPTPQGAEGQTPAAGDGAENGDVKAGTIQKPEAGKDAAYVAAVNEFVALNAGKMPESGLTTEQVIALNDATKAANLEAQDAAAKTQAQEPAAQVSRHGEMIDIVNTKTKETTRVSEHTFNNFIAKNQPEWQRKGDVPQEVKNLKKNGK